MRKIDGSFGVDKARLHLVLALYHVWQVLSLAFNDRATSPRTDSVHLLLVEQALVHVDHWPLVQIIDGLAQ